MNNDLYLEKKGICHPYLGLPLEIPRSPREPRRLEWGRLTRPLTRRFDDPRVIRWGFLASAVSLLVIPLAGSLPAFLLAVGLLSACTSVPIPAITSLTSNKAAISQGAAMGLSNSFVSLGRIFGPALGGLVFDLNWILPFAVGALVMGVGFAISRERVKPRG